jgi:Tol biopolymer transport system component
LSPGELQPTLFRINADGSGEQLVMGEVQEFAFDPSGRKVVFVRNVTIEPDERNPEGGTFPEIFVAPTDDLNAAVKITDLRASRTGGAKWGPDALQIVFSTNYDGDEEIWTMTDDGQNVRQLTNNEIFVDREPAWSPDGSTIVFVSDRDSPGFTEIYSILATSPEGPDNPVIRLTDAANSSYAPVWSPDGSKIAFISDRESGDGDVYMMDPDGNRPELLTYDTVSEDRSPSFSPDLRYIAFISNREDDLFQTYLVNIATREVIRVTNNGQDDRTVVFLPNILLSLR